MQFEIIGEITDVETIAVGSSIREIARLRRIYGTGRWRKLKGMAMVRLADGTMCEQSTLVRSSWVSQERLGVWPEMEAGGETK